MTLEAIMNKLLTILSEQFSLQKETAYENREMPLTGSKIGLNYISLYEFLMCVEETFNIYFSPNDIRQYGFKTLDEVQNLVDMKLKQRA